MQSVFYVWHSDGHWKIELGSMTLGPYRTQACAIEVAVEAASSCQKNGSPSRVVAETGQPGEWQTVWPAPADK